MTPESLLQLLELGHVDATYERQRRYAVRPVGSIGPILFITVPEDDDEPSLDDAVIVDEDLHEHPLSARERIAATAALRRVS